MGVARKAILPRECARDDGRDEAWGDGSLGSRSLLGLRVPESVREVESAKGRTMAAWHPCALGAIEWRLEEYVAGVGARQLTRSVASTSGSAPGQRRAICLFVIVYGFKHRSCRALYLKP